MNDSDNMAAWERAFWTAFGPTPCAHYHARTTPDGIKLTCTIATVGGHGLRLIWRSPRAALVTISRDPIKATEKGVPGAEQTPVTIEGDPAAAASYVRSRLAAMA